MNCGYMGRFGYQRRFPQGERRCTMIQLHSNGQFALSRKENIVSRKAPYLFDYRIYLPAFACSCCAQARLFFAICSVGSRAIALWNSPIAISGCFFTM